MGVVGTARAQKEKLLSRVKIPSLRYKAVAEGGTAGVRARPKAAWSGQLAASQRFQAWAGALPRWPMLPTCMQAMSSQYASDL